MKKQLIIFLSVIVLCGVSRPILPAAEKKGEFAVTAPAGCGMMAMQLGLKKAPDRYGKCKKIKSSDVITESMILDAYAAAKEKEAESCASPNRLFGTPGRLGTPGRSGVSGLLETARDFFLEYIYLALLEIDPVTAPEEELTDPAIAQKIKAKKEKAVDDHDRLELLSRAELFFKRTQKK
ncbi:hypothetical protein K2W90_03690 [Candidatus Babeliales bacterium]|nr:hypothetical protein [Candidatus Babeliales bacterium]